jgi:hypothetical protein
MRRRANLRIRCLTFSKPFTPFNAPNISVYARAMGYAVIGSPACR